ncbi:hypothetical protein MKX01_036719 [Papaver californicum]|nr:hypothetical protein MKX01_036719 [Papaver californicum]
MVKDKKKSDREGFEEDIYLELSLGPSTKHIRSSYSYSDTHSSSKPLNIPYVGNGNGIVPPIFHGGGGFDIPNHPGSGGGRRNSRIRVRAENVVDLDVLPFEWATNRFAKIHDRDHLIAKGIHTISGEVHMIYKVNYWRLVLSFTTTKRICVIRATDNWMTPVLETCPRCDQPNSLKSMIPSDKGLINWLFLFLGQMIGCCTLEQLKFFCHKNSLHRTGTKDRLIFLTYLSLCKQLDPTGPFELDGC